MTFNDEQYKYLEELEIHLYHAYYESYCRIINKDVLKVMDSIYQDVYKTSSKLLDGCGRCIYSDIRKLAKSYFADKEERNAKKDIKKAQNEPVDEPKQVEQPVKPKKAAKTTKTAKNKKK